MSLATDIKTKDCTPNPSNFHLGISYTTDVTNTRIKTLESASPGFRHHDSVVICASIKKSKELNASHTMNLKNKQDILNTILNHFLESFLRF